MNVKKELLWSVLWLILMFFALSHQETAIGLRQSEPKLMVGFVIDQIHADDLAKFKSNIGRGGFLRLLSNGFRAKKVHCNYVPVATDSGHVSIYTGSTPKIHDMIERPITEDISFHIK